MIEGFNLKAIRLYGAMDLRIDEINEPKCGPGEVKLRTECCGLCGSDRPRVLHGSVPFFPNTIGHEFSATVMETGEGVTSVKPGDLVVGVPLLVCHKCENCKNGNFGECLYNKFMGLRVKDMGAFAKYNVLPETNVLKLPRSMDRISAAFVEPASVAIHSILRSGFKPGKDVAVVGAGTIGQLIIQCARIMGAKRIFAFDLKDKQLEEAKKLGADFCYNTHDDSFLTEYLKETDGLGCPYIFEAVGYQDTILLSINLCKVNGNIALVGHLEGTTATFPHKYLRMLCEKEVNLFGVWMSYDLNFPGDSWRLAIHYISSGQIDVKSMIYKVVPAEQVLDVCKEWQDPDKVNGKIMLTFDNL